MHTEFETPTGPLEQDTDRKKTSAKYVFDEKLVSRIHKELLKLNNKMNNNQMVKNLKVGKISEQTRHQRRYMDNR